VPVFVDTNVLVYARDDADRAKHDRAGAWMRHLWESGSGRLSTQVLQEFYVTTTRKLRPGLAPEDARADVRDLLAWQPLVTTAAELEAAWAVEERFGLSFWDALIVASAQSASCDTLLTEDLQHGLEIDGLIVLDPFSIPVPGGHGS
jgi:predicted nucleic acid-binding protein